MFCSFPMSRFGCLVSSCLLIGHWCNDGAVTGHSPHCACGRLLVCEDWSWLFWPCPSDLTSPNVVELVVSWSGNPAISIFSTIQYLQISEFPLHCDPIFENAPHNIKELLRNLNNNSWYKKICKWIYHRHLNANNRVLCHANQIHQDQNIQNHTSCIKIDSFIH